MIGPRLVGGDGNGEDVDIRRVFLEKQLADDPANTIGLYDLAIAYRHAGLVHKELAKSDDQEIRQVQRAAEKENYQRALNSLLKAQAQKALPEFSRKLIETYRKDIEELDKLQ